jgi:hypothetical protein
MNTACLATINGFGDAFALALRSTPCPEPGPARS